MSTYIYPILLNKYPILSEISSCNSISAVDIQRYGTYTFWSFSIPSAVFIYYDYIYDKNKKYHIYRLQAPGRNLIKKINWNLYKKATYLTVRNSICFTFNYLTFIIPSFYYYRGICNDFWFENYSYFDIVIFIFIKMPLLLFLSDAYFYVTHRIFHEFKYLYKTMHKIHHEFVDSIACVVGAAHPVEHCIANIGSASIPCLILGTPIGFSYVWFGVATINSIFSHCGYNTHDRMGGVPHDFHHHFQDVVFGAGGYCDTLFSTRMIDKYPKQWQQFNSIQNHQNKVF